VSAAFVEEPTVGRRRLTDAAVGYGTPQKITHPYYCPAAPPSTFLVRPLVITECGLDGPDCSWWHPPRREQRDSLATRR